MIADLLHQDPATFAAAICLVAVILVRLIFQLRTIAAIVQQRTDQNPIKSLEVKDE